VTARPDDVTALRRYLAERDLVAADADVRPIGDGHSNIIYLVDDGRRSVVVRRPPPPPHPPGAHDVLREARIQHALAGSDVPVPQILAVEEGTDTIGVPFYVMEHLIGHVLTTTTPAAFDRPSHRREIAEAFIDTLAALHGVDPVAVGLADSAPRQRDSVRPLSRVARLLTAGDAALEGPLGSLQAGLIESAPPPGPLVVVHGDFRPGNLMIAPDPPVRVLAVLDWELASAGDPMTDLGYLLATYARPGDAAPHALTELGRATCADGYPERAELAARYAAATGRDISNVAWFMAAALWKLAVLFEYQRRRLLTGSGDPFYAHPALVGGLVAAAERILDRDRM
jgi:aminoglycoside phosphotransferase (APT) family kinase protein